MRFLSTTLHGVADYLVGLIVIALPLLYGWVGWPLWSMVGLGVFVIVYSLLTDYELSAVRVLSMPVHLTLDALFAVLLLAAPVLLDFPAGERWPNYVIGVLSLVIVAITRVPRPASI